VLPFDLIITNTLEKRKREASYHIQEWGDMFSEIYLFLIRKSNINICFEYKVIPRESLTT